MDKPYRYTGYFLLLLIPLIFAKFCKSYFQPFPKFSLNINMLVHLHAFIACVWVIGFCFRCMEISRFFKRPQDVKMRKANGNNFIYPKNKSSIVKACSIKPRLCILCLRPKVVISVSSSFFLVPVFV